MRVLLLAQSYLPVSGGLQRVVHDLARGLVSNGDQVLVVVKRYPRQLPAAETIDAIPVRRLYFYDPAWADVRQGRPAVFAFSLLAAPRAHRQLAQLVRNFAPDVIHFHYPHQLLPFVWPILDLCLARLVVSFHGSEIEEIEHELAAYQPVLRRVLDRADWVTAVSRASLNEAVAFHPFSLDKGRVVYNGMHADAFTLAEPRYSYSQARPYILMVGRLVEAKGFDLLIAAFALLAADFPMVDVWLAGDGPLRAALERQTAQSGLVGRVQFLGNCARPEVQQLMRGCYFFVVPSRVEPFGLVTLEAMAQERRVIATAVGGLAEVVAGASNVIDNQLVAVDVEQLSAAMRRWLIEPAFVQQSAANRQYAMQFTLERMVNSYHQLYEDSSRG